MVAPNWKQVTALGGKGVNTDEVGRARTPDGVLHLVWNEALDGNASRIQHTAIPAAGKGLLGPDTAVSFSNGINNRPGLTATNNTLRLFFAGLEPGSPIDSTLATARSSDGGKVWEVEPTPASNSASPHPVYAAAGIAGLEVNGLFFSIWGDSSPSGGALHKGLSNSSPDFELPGACCQIDPNLAAVEGTDSVFAGWNDLGSSAVVIQPINPGDPGPTLSIPNSGAMQSQTRLKMTGRIGGSGLFVAYTIGTNQFLGRPALFRLPGNTTLVASQVRGGQDVGVAAAPEGRLWVFWHRGRTIYARRSNEAATKLGATVQVRPPGGESPYTLDGEASLGPLDLLANVQVGARTAFFHQRLRPGLTLKLSPANVSSKKGGLVKATVTDAGAAVPGANVAVKIKGKDPAGTTGPNGRTTLTIPKGLKRGLRTATASRSGYAKATARLRIRK